MTKKPSVAIIGGGHNGLICAAYLARAGLKVTVFEAQDKVGGALAQHTLSDGAAASSLVPSHYPLNSAIVKELKLKGATGTTPAAINTTLLNAEGAHITISGNKISDPGCDAQTKADFQAFREEYLGYAAALKALMLSTPPRLKNIDWTDKKTLAKLGLNLRFGLGRDAMREFLRIVGMNVFDVLEERFGSELLKGGIAADAVFGQHVGPKTPTTVLSMLMRMFQQAGANTERQCAAVYDLAGQLEAAARAAKVDIRTGSKVASVIVENDRAAGITLENGETFKADLVVSNADAKSTLLGLVGPQNLDAMFTHRISKTRTDGDVARCILLLDRPPEFTGLTSTHYYDRLLVAPSMRYVERAFNHSKYGEFSENPVLDIKIQRPHTEAGPTPQHTVMTVNAMFAPYALRQGWRQGKKLFEARIIETLSEYSPNIGASVVYSELWTPSDIEEKFLTTGGHWHHGEVAIDQAFMMRPVPGASQYGMPLPGLYLCGAAAHPGGDITGLPGRNAARRILAEM